MGTSVRPQSIDDDLSAIRSRQSSPIDSDLARIRSMHEKIRASRDTGDIDLRAQADDTAVTPSPSGPGLLERTATGVSEMAKDIYHHPQHLITQPLSAAADALFTPVEGSESSGIGGRGGKASLPTGARVTKENTPGAITPERQREAGIETLVNVGAAGAAGKVAKVVAPALGKALAPAAGRAVANFTAGAVTNPTDPIASGLANIPTGEVAHHTMERVVEHAPELAEKISRDRRSTPRGNAPVWTQEERDAHHAEQLAAHKQGLRSWKPGQPSPSVSEPLHPDAMQQIFDQGKTQPFPYQTVASLKAAERPLTIKPGPGAPDEAVVKAVRAKNRKPVANAVDPKYRLDSDADLVARAGELSGRAEDYSSGEHGAPAFTRDAQDLSKPIYGSTTTQTRMTQDNALYQGAVAELKARGWKDSDIADAVDERAGMQYRHAGPSLDPSQIANVRDALNTTFHAAADQVRRANPDLAAAGERAIASKANATHIGQVQTKWVTEGIDPRLAESFLPQLQLDRLNHLASRDPALIHDPAFAKNLSDLQSRVPQGFSETPEFKQMAERYKTGILAQTESAAGAAGLKPEQFADLPNGYARLVANPEADPSTIAESVGGTGTRQNPSTRLTTAQKATGTGAYTNSLAETVTADAMDKVVKARQNEFYKELLKSGTVLEDPRASVPKGQAKIMFDDRANVIDDPAQAKITLQVPQSVSDYARHVWTELSRDETPKSPAGRVMKTLDRAASTAALAVNPAAATTHISTLSNILGSTPTPGAPLKALAGLVPGGKTALGIADWASVDRTSPKVRQLESDLSSHGGLRPEARELNPAEANAVQKVLIAAKKTPLKNANPHEWLFGENGVDKRVRLALAQRFIDSETARTGKAPPMHEVAAFVNKKAGNYIAGNAGTLVNALQRSKASLFARMATARLSNAGKMITGNTGMPGVRNRIQGLLLGTPGYLLGLEVLNHLISGHSIASNQPGHHADLQYGTDDEGRPKYIRGSFVDPLSSTAINRTGASSLLFDGSVRGAVRDVENTALGVATSHPLTRAAFGAGMGKEPYITGSGDLKSVGHPSLDKGTGELKSRMGATASGLTSVGQSIAGTTGGNEGMSPTAGKVLKFLGPSITSVGTPTENPSARERQSVEENWLKDRVSQIYRTDPKDRKQVAQDIMAELDASDYSTVAKAVAKKQLVRAMVVPDAVRNTISNVKQRPYALSK